MIVSVALGGLLGLILAGLRMFLLRREISRFAAGGGMPPLALLGAALGARLLPLVVVGALVVTWSPVAAVAALCAYWVARTMLLVANARRWTQVR